MIHNNNLDQIEIYHLYYMEQDMINKEQQQLSEGEIYEYEY